MTEDLPLVPLFVYGRLIDRSKPVDVPINGTLKITEDGDAAARFNLLSQSLVWGQVLWITESEMQSLDLFEHPDYKPVKVMLATGVVAHAFWYVGSNWLDLEVRPSGRFYDE